MVAETIGYTDEDREKAHIRITDDFTALCLGEGGRLSREYKKLQGDNAEHSYTDFLDEVRDQTDRYNPTFSPEFLDFVSSNKDTPSIQVLALYYSKMRNESEDIIGVGISPVPDYSFLERPRS